MLGISGVIGVIMLVDWKFPSRKGLSNPLRFLYISLIIRSDFSYEVHELVVESDYFDHGSSVSEMSANHDDELFFMEGVTV